MEKEQNGLWKAGVCVGDIPTSMMKRFLGLSLREEAAWKQIEAISESRIKLFGELDREFNLKDWIYYIDNIKGGIVLERHKTRREIELQEVHEVLIENSEGKKEVI